MPDSLVELERRALQLKRQIRSVSRPLTAEETEHVRAESQAIRQAIADTMVDRMIHQRPEVVTRGAPVSHVAVERGRVEARNRLREKPEFKAACSDCPAAQVRRRIDDVVEVKCRVEGTTLTSHG